MLRDRGNFMNWNGESARQTPFERFSHGLGFRSERFWLWRSKTVTTFCKAYRGGCQRGRAASGERGDNQSPYKGIYLKPWLWEKIPYPFLKDLFSELAKLFDEIEFSRRNLKHKQKRVDWLRNFVKGKLHKVLFTPQGNCRDMSKKWLSVNIKTLVGKLPYFFDGIKKADWKANIKWKLCVKLMTIGAAR